MKQTENKIRYHLFIPFREYDGKIGGPSTFMENLERYLKEKQFNYYSNFRHLKKSCGIFFPVSFDKYFLDFFKQNSFPVIQRLDGVYYPSKHGQAFEELNRDIKDIYQNYSEYIIFQSSYSKQQCFEMFGEKHPEKYSVIINGADKKIFFPSLINNNEKTPIPEIFQIITTGSFRNIDMIEPVILALDRLIENYKFILTIAGPVPNDKIRQVIKRKYIRHISKASLIQVAGYLRASDIMIYSHLNPPCPNSVIEAVSCGVPVTGFKSGAMKELLFFADDLLADVPDKIFQEYSDFDPGLLKEKIEYTFNNYTEIKKRALNYSHLYSFSETGSKYLEIFNQLLAKNSFPSSK